MEDSQAAIRSRVGHHDSLTPLSRMRVEEHFWWNKTPTKLQRDTPSTREKTHSLSPWRKCL